MFAMLKTRVEKPNFFQYVLSVLRTDFNYSEV